MSSGRRTASAKRGLLAGVALLVLSWTGAAQAQARVDQTDVGRQPIAGKTGTTRPARPAVGVLAGDGLKDGELYLEADLVTRNDRTKVTTANGDVEVRYQDRTIRANELIYDEGRGVMTAKGHVQILNPDGSVEFADQIVLDDAMKAGAAVGFSARMPGNIKMAGASAIRRNGQVNELNRAIYTPCDICATDGSSKTPTWSIRADKVVQDHAHQLVYYRNAVIQIMGVPVLFLPVFWHPDPDAVRKSGFLEPKFGASNRRGISYEQPYLQVLSNSSDITISPQLNTKINPFLNGRYRQRFYSGALDARFGFTHDSDFDGKGHAFGDNTTRSYILASGAFALNDKWRWGFTAERTSDDRIFDKYEIGGVYVARGPYIADDRRLISQVYATRQDEKSWFSAGAFSIQGLRTTDNDRTFPFVGPLIEARWEPNIDLLNGRLRLLGSAVALTRDQSPSNAALPGLDSRRVTAEADWRSTYTLANGVRISPFADLRADGYSIADMSGMTSASKSQGRGLAVAGADVTWPFARRFKSSTVVIEPVAQFAISPKATQIIVSRSATGTPTYLDEDNLAFEFDETNLFRANKFPGYDLYEDGARLNLAGRASVFWDDGRRASLLVGRSFRDTANSVFSSTSGLQSKSSDWIVAGDAQPMKGVSLFGRARLDGNDLSMQRAEAGVNFTVKRGNGYFRYLRNVADPNGSKVENLDMGGEVYLSKHWGLTAYGNRDLVQDGWVIRDVGVVYRDECTRIDVIYRREDTVVGRLGPSESIAVRLTLATLGGPMYAN